MNRCCPYCQSKQVVKKGFFQNQDGTGRQRYLCRSCDKQFSDRTGTPMARLRKPASQVAKVPKMRSNGWLTGQKLDPRQRLPTVM